MTYKKIHLIVDDFVLSNMVNIFRHIKGSVDSNSINYPNFGRYPEDMSVRIRIDFLTPQAEQTAMRAVNELVSNHTINHPDTNHWVIRNQDSAIIKSACTLSSECACILSDLPYYSTTSVQNPIPQNFFPCLVYRLFQEIDIDLNFRPSEIQTIIEREQYQDMISVSIDAVTSGVIFNRTDFFNPTFFERFVHMLWNNLIVAEQGEELFWNLFWRRNRTSGETLKQTRQRFCNELNSV